MPAFLVGHAAAFITFGTLVLAFAFCPNPTRWRADPWLVVGGAFWLFLGLAIAAGVAAAEWTAARGIGHGW